jgi:hypothetical protein
MNIKVFSFSLVLLALSCNSNNSNEALLLKENELLKKEVELQKMKNELLKKEKQIKRKTNFNNKKKINKKLKKTENNNLHSLIYELSQLLGETLQKIDTEGNISYDSGTASSGRFSGNLRDVNINLKYHTDSDCDGCPSQGILANIVFTCKNNLNCLEDMGFKQSSSLMSFSNKNKAKKVYEILIQIQNNL